MYYKFIYLYIIIVIVCTTRGRWHWQLYVWLVTSAVVSFIVCFLFLQTSKHEWPKPKERLAAEEMMCVCVCMCVCCVSVCVCMSLCECVCLYECVCVVCHCVCVVCVSVCHCVCQCVWMCHVSVWVCVHFGVDWKSECLTFLHWGGCTCLSTLWLYSGRASSPDSELGWLHNLVVQRQVEKKKCHCWINMHLFKVCFSQFWSVVCSFVGSSVLDEQPTAGCFGQRKPPSTLWRFLLSVAHCPRWSVYLCVCVC